MGKHRRTLVVAACLAAVLLLSVGSPAAAHASVASSDPSAGAVIDDPVTEITLVFTDQAEPIGDGFQVIEADGDVRAPNEWESPDGRTFVLHFDPPITGGETGMRWTIRAADAHALNGEFTFTVDAAEPITTTTSVIEATVDEAADTPDESTAVGESVPSPAVEGERAADTANETTMIESAAVAVVPDPSTTDLDLNGSAEVRSLGLVGRLVTLIGSLTAIGALVFLVRVLRGSREEGLLVTSVARRAAVAVAAGSVIEAAAQVVVQGGGWGSLASPVVWVDVLSSRFGAAVALHLIGAFGVATGSHFRRETIGSQTSVAVRANLSTAGVGSTGRPSPSDAGLSAVDGLETGAAPPIPLLYRWHPSPNSSGAVLGVVALLAASVVDGHTLGHANPLLSAIATATHVLAGSAWLGGIIVLFLILRGRLQARRHVEAADVAVRYSVMATVSLVVVAAAGVALTVSRPASLGELWATDWGRLVLAKLGLVGIVALVGAVNHFVTIPRLAGRAEPDGLGMMLRRLLATEIVVLLAVVAVTAQLVATGFP